MAEILWPLAALLGWAALLYKLWDLRRDPASLPLRLICVTFVCMAVTATLGLPAAYVGLDRLVGIPNLSALVMNACGMCFVLAVQRLLQHWVYPPERARRSARWWRWLYLLAFVAQVVLFAQAGVDEESPWFIARYADTPFAREFMVLVDVCLAITFTDIVRLCWRYASAAGRRYLRVGLRGTGIGAACGVLYFPLEALYVVARSTDVRFISGDLLGQLFTLLGMGCALFITGGLTIPAWGPRLAAGMAWANRYRAYHALHPLWLDLYQASPHIALDVPATIKDPLWIDDLDYRLVRRVVEIRDGRLALRPYFSAAVAANARHEGVRAGLRGIRLQATIEAATIAAAIRAKREHVESADPYACEAPGGADLADETAWLGHVARATTRLASRPWPDRDRTHSGQPASRRRSRVGR